MGRRVGKKRSDRRWIADDGTEWDSKFEWSVYDRLSAGGGSVRKCDESDSFSYTKPIRGAACLGCGSGEVVQRRTYTPDLYYVPAPDTSPGVGYYIEVKGYFPGTKRALFRNFLKCHPDVSIRIVLERNSRAPGTKSTYGDYIDKFFKIPWVVRLDGLAAWERS